MKQSCIHKKCKSFGKCPLLCSNHCHPENVISASPPPPQIILLQRIPCPRVVANLFILFLDIGDVQMQVQSGQSYLCRTLVQRIW